jgi:hypothetical protein
MECPAEPGDEKGACAEIDDVVDHRVVRLNSKSVHCLTFESLFEHVQNNSTAKSPEGQEKN